LKRVVVLGSTGSIGRQTLDVVARRPDEFRVVALAAGKDVATIREQCRRFRPRVACLTSEEAATQLRECLGPAGPEVLSGDEGLSAAAVVEADVVVLAVTGLAALPPLLAALDVGRDVALASKETLVAAGGVVTARALKGGARLIPVDSEHSAVFQCLAGNERTTVRRVVLTASGGAFLRASVREMERATPQQALDHPRWRMGAKVTVDSATLMNKGLEIIEACWLFDLRPAEVDVLIHPESIVHALVEFHDGSVLAQLAVPDMRLPIAYALSYPDRVDTGWPRLDLAKVAGLSFEPPDEDRFPALGLARWAIEAGGTLPCVMSAADEVAVTAFLKGRIGFTDICWIVADVMKDHSIVTQPDLADILWADGWARRKTAEVVSRGR